MSYDVDMALLTLLNAEETHDLVLLGDKEADWVVIENSGKDEA